MLDVVFRYGPITRSEISTRSGLSKPTVSAALQHLMRTGLVVEAGQRTGTPGRVATLFAVDSRVGFVIGIDIGANRIRLALANIYGETLREEQHTTDRRGGDAVIDEVADLAEGIAAHSGVAWSEVVSICVATPGIVDPETRTVRLAGNIPGWEGAELHGNLEKRLQRPLVIENDINLAAVGEKWKGLGRDVQTFVFVSIGSGIGMGIVIDNELFRGAHGGAGEIAFLPIGEDPFAASHRHRGALEDHAATVGIMKAVAQADDWHGSRPASVEEVFALAEFGDDRASAIVLEEARMIGIAIASVSAIIDPELVVLGGGIGMNPALLRPVRDVVGILSPIPPRIERSLLGEKAALNGALAEALQDGRAALFNGR